MKPKASLTATCFFSKLGETPEYINYSSASENCQLRHRKHHADTNH